MEATLWIDAQRAPLIGTVLDRMGTAIRPIAMGGPRSTPVAQLADKFGLSTEDDPRKLLINHPAAFVVLASVQGIGRDTLLHAIGHGAIILTIEPATDALETLTAINGKNTAPAAGRFVTLPAFGKTPGWTSAADPGEVLGPLRSLSFSSLGNRGECSLFARLFDAWQTILGLTPIPESIDASIVQPGELPEDLRDITGHLSAHARNPDGCSVVLQISDHAGAHERQLSILGDQGVLRVTDLSYSLCDSMGKPLDHKAAPSPSPASDQLFADLLVKQWARLLDRPESIAPLPPAQSDARVLACCLASLLSARTGQAESPAKLLSLHSLT